MNSSYLWVTGSVSLGIMAAIRWIKTTGRASKVAQGLSMPSPIAKIEEV